MNRKAFTLIELIAVIVILSLVALVVFPAVNSVIRNSREKAYENQIKTIVKAAEECSYENTAILPNEGKKTKLNLVCLTKGCVLDGVNVEGGYINEDDIKDPRKTSKNIEGCVVITYEATTNQTIKQKYKYEYRENCAAEIGLNTTGGWLLKNSNIENTNGIYKGQDVNNYINFSGSTWRILKVNEDGTLTLVKNTEVTTMPWDNNQNVTDSNTLDYLNDTYYNSLNQKKYLTNSSTCIKTEDNQCSEAYTSKVTLLTYEDYKNANGINCNNETCTNDNYLSNYSILNGAEYITNANAQVMTINNGVLAGASSNQKLNVRPVVTLKNNTKIVSGQGTNESPYVIG